MCFHQIEGLYDSRRQTFPSSPVQVYVVLGGPTELQTFRRSFQFQFLPYSENNSIPRRSAFGEPFRARKRSCVETASRNSSCLTRTPRLGAKKFVPKTAIRSRPIIYNVRRRGGPSSRATMGLHRICRAVAQPSF